MIPDSMDTYNNFNQNGSENSTASLNDTSRALAASESFEDLWEELNNPMSFWQELRLTAMSGTDYVFVPNFIYSAFGPSYSLSRFVNELSYAFSLDPTRLQIICLQDNAVVPTYSKAILEWTDGAVTHDHLEVIPPHSTYYDFMLSMYEHSSPAVSQPDH